MGASRTPISRLLFRVEKAYQVPIRDIAALTTLNLDHLTAADQLTPIPAARTDQPRTGWMPLLSRTDIRLDHTAD